MALESKFQRNLRATIKRRFEGAHVYKQDALAQQGIPDLLILFGNKWAMLEVKKSENAPHRPNQDYWVDHYNQMGFARFIFPENKEEVLNELESYFTSGD